MRLIGSNGEQVGIVLTVEALEKAVQEGLDLVEISPNVEPPVCRLMDFGKYQFQLNKKKAAAKKKQKKFQIKEIKFRPTTDVGDYQVKLRNIRRFLEDGDKVKVTVRFRGREMQHKELGLNMLNRLKQDLIDEAIVEQEAKLEGRQIMMVIAPSKKKS